jgi:hypothetical protein
MQSANRFPLLSSVAADVEHEDIALAAGAGVARSLAGGDDVELLVVR